MPAERSASPKRLAQARKTFAVLRKGGLTRWQSVLLLTHPSFTPALLQVADEKTAADEFARRTDEALSRFKGHPAEYFRAKPTVDEFHNYLMLERKLKPAQAAFHSLILQRASPHYKLLPEAAGVFALKNWARWKAERVLDVLDVRDYNRDRALSQGRQEEKRKLLAADLAEAFVHGAQTPAGPSLRLRVLWGGHKESERGKADERDEKVLDRVAALRDKLSALGAPATVDLLFSDIHAEKINGVEPQRVEAYRASLQKEAEKRGFTLTPMSRVWDASNPLAVPGWASQDEARSLVGQAAKVMTALEELGLAAQGSARAEKHSERVARGEATPSKAGELYGAVRAVEEHMLNRARQPGTLYVTFADPKTSSEYNPTHTLYWWSFGRGHGETPWFTRKKPDN